MNLAIMIMTTVVYVNRNFAFIDLVKYEFLFCADDCIVKDIAVIEESQRLLLRCLFYLFKKNGQSETKKFAQIISCLMQLRTVKELYNEAQEMLINDWAGKIELPPLLFEMWSS